MLLLCPSWCVVAASPCWCTPWGALYGFCFPACFSCVFCVWVAPWAGGPSPAPAARGAWVSSCALVCPVAHLSPTSRSCGRGSTLVALHGGRCAAFSCRAFAFLLQPAPLGGCCCARGPPAPPGAAAALVGIPGRVRAHGHSWGSAASTSKPTLRAEHAVRVGCPRPCCPGRPGRAAAQARAGRSNAPAGARALCAAVRAYSAPSSRCIAIIWW